MEAVLVLNADLGPLHRVSLKHAIRMLFRQVAEVHEAEPDRLIGVRTHAGVAHAGRAAAL